MLNTGIVKPFKTYSEQVQLLIDRGLIVPDIKRAEEILKHTNYNKTARPAATGWAANKLSPSRQ